MRERIAGLGDGVGQPAAIPFSIEERVRLAALLPAMLEVVRQGLAAGSRDVGVIGVTSEDMFRRGTNFNFAYALNGVGVVSYKRFSTPDRLQLRRRLRNQIVASTASMFGVPRCRNAECPTARTGRISELVRKGDRLCEECVANFEKEFGVKGAPLPDPEAVAPDALADYGSTPMMLTIAGIVGTLVTLGVVWCIGLAVRRRTVAAGGVHEGPV